jgi:type IV pilus assembly protein PilB
LDREIAERYMAVPLGEVKSRLAVAMLDAGNVQAVDFLANKIGRQLKVYMASETGIKKALELYGQSLDHSIGKSLETTAAGTEEGGKESKKGSAEVQIKTLVEDSPISKALNAIMEYAVKNGASDIHVEPTENDLRIRSRVDGVLREIMRMPKSSEAPLISRIKILSNLKIDEHRIPQDGQFAVKIDDKEVDLRIAVSPVVWGEQAVIRLLDKSGTSFKLEDLGFHGHALETIRKSITRPNGMIINSGPTGSGKTTSLYALIQEIKNDTINIVTLEDPVEYKMDGVNQMQVNNEVGLTFASGLRSILRQDPNVVMVGEIRDQETAALAVQAALTGHLVFSTLHTNSAAGVLPRLLDMGVEPFLIASTVNTIIGQRLVRTLTKDKKPYESTKTETIAINNTIGGMLPKDEGSREKVSTELGYDKLPVANENAYTLYRGQDTNNTPGGYKGRIGLYEVIDVNEKIEEMIMERKTSTAIMKMARKNGTVSMRQDGYFKVLNGLTTIDEVNRVAALGTV